MEAGEAGADYVAFGAFFPSTTKPSEHRPDPELLTWWSRLFEIPCVAIGGITPENCAPLVEAGAGFLAGSGAGRRGEEAGAIRSFAARHKRGLMTQRQPPGFTSGQTLGNCVGPVRTHPPGQNGRKAGGRK